MILLIIIEIIWYITAVLMIISCAANLNISEKGQGSGWVCCILWVVIAVIRSLPETVRIFMNH